jgi:hypothetical protein
MGIVDFYHSTSDDHAHLALPFSGILFAATLPFLVSGVTLIVYSAKKMDTIANDYNRQHKLSSSHCNVQIKLGFTPNEIGMKLTF